MRKCWNWQTSKTKDLVAAMTCGFKSHLPHLALGKFRIYQGFFLSKTFYPFLFYSPGGSLGKQRVSRGAFEFPYSSIPFVDSLKSIL